MNRRDFIESLAASVAGVQLLPAIACGVSLPTCLGGTPLSATAAPTLESSKPRVSWIENGLIDAGGNHEPYIFLVRRGGQPLNYRQIYEPAQSEEVVKLLQSQGVEVFRTRFYRGFGMAAEMPGLHDTIRTAAIAHRYGMKVDAYIQWDTMMYETFFAEESRAEQCGLMGLSL
jgi:hypothetical protein